MKQLHIIFILACFFTSISSAEVVDRQAERNERLLASFKPEEGITYKTIAGEQLDLTLFLPKEPSAGKMPIMVYTHGGGWGGGDKYRIFGRAYLDTMRRLLDEGIAIATIEYRLTRVGTSTTIDSVEDCKDAVRFLVKHADDYGIDPDRIGLWGGSAGGHLALMTGLADNTLFKGDEKLRDYDPEFRCIVAYYPATTFQHPELLKGSNFERPERMIPIIGGLAADFPGRVELLSPTEHLHKESPPVLLMHGDKDTILPIGLSEYFMTVAKEREANATFIVVKQGGHSFSGVEIEPTMKEINDMAAEFILEHLKAD